MARNLTDLMESAVASAPPEPHRAYDITRLAQRHQRRRTTFVAAGATLAVVAVTGVGFGVTRGGHDASPEPAAPLEYGQVVSLSDAVPARSVPGFQEIHYSVAPVDHRPSTRQEDQQGVPNPASAEYTDIDAEGRLVVERRAAGDTSPVLTVVLDGPTSTTSSAQAPARPPTDNGFPTTWLARFVGDGRLLWTPTAPVVQEGSVGIHVTDLAGGHDQPLVLDHTQPGPPSGGTFGVWAAGDRLWFTNQLPSDDPSAPPVYGLYSTQLDDPSSVTSMAENTAGAAVSDGTVGWVTPDGRGSIADAEGDNVRSFALPLDQNCVVDPFGGELQDVAVSAGLLAFTERCGSGDTVTTEPVVVDETGRLVLHVDTDSATDLALSDGVFAFQGSDPATPKALGTYRADLRTGVLAELGQAKPDLRAPVVAGSYVLWHDDDSFHVGRFGE